MRETASTVVIGVGNEYRKDDAVGLYVARRLADLQLQGVEVICGISDGSALLDLWYGRERCFVIDCACSQSSAGAIFRFNAGVDRIPVDLFSVSSTHNISIAAAVALAEAVARLPRSLIVYGIEGSDFSTGQGLSKEVKLAAEKTVELIRREIREPALEQT
jgi:hydrogenase maturation protease